MDYIRNSLTVQSILTDDEEDRKKAILEKGEEYNITEEEKERYEKLKRQEEKLSTLANHQSEGNEGEQGQRLRLPLPDWRADLPGQHHEHAAPGAETRRSSGDPFP